jgi:propionate CoA-transferase
VNQGFSRLSHPGIVKSVTTPGVNNCPRLAEPASQELIEAYVFPQGVLSQLCQDRAAGRPGLVTEVVIHTVVDPRYEGAIQSARTAWRFVEVVTVGDRGCLFYLALPVDVAVVYGTTTDENGSITMEDEAFRGEMFSIACAARGRSQLRGCRSGPSPNLRDRGRTGICRYHSGSLRLRAETPFGIRKSMARMAVLAKDILNTVTPQWSREVLAAYPPGARMPGPAGTQMPWLISPISSTSTTVGGLDIALLSFAQVDVNSNVNVSTFGRTVGGSGGFINTVRAPAVLSSLER